MAASSLTPMLTVNDANAAVDLYRDAFSAVQQPRFVAPTGYVSPISQSIDCSSSSSTRIRGRST